MEKFKNFLFFVLIFIFYGFSFAITENKNCNCSHCSSLKEKIGNLVTEYYLFQNSKKEIVDRFKNGSEFFPESCYRTYDDLFDIMLKNKIEIVLKEVDNFLCYNDQSGVIFYVKDNKNDYLCVSVLKYLFEEAYSAYNKKKQIQNKKQLDGINDDSKFNQLKQSVLLYDEINKKSSDKNQLHEGNLSSSDFLSHEFEKKNKDILDILEIDLNNLHCDSFLKLNNTGKTYKCIRLEPGKNYNQFIGTCEKSFLNLILNRIMLSFCQFKERNMTNDNCYYYWDKKKGIIVIIS
jgi:hypothetical protein